MQGQAQIDLLKRAGFRGQGLRNMWAIMQRESGGNAQAFNGNRSTGDQSYGLFQINMLGKLGSARRRQYGLQSNEDLFDPLTNAKIAYRMSSGGTNLGAWGVGANAYKGAPPTARTKYEQWLTKFPGDARPGVEAKARVAGSGIMFGAGTDKSPQQVDNDDAVAMGTRQLLGEKFRENAIARRTGRPPELGGLIQFAKDRKVLQASLAPSADPYDDGGAQIDGGDYEVRPGMVAGVKNASPAQKAILGFAHQQIGQDYVWGAESRAEGGFDCSGLIDAAYRAAGIDLPGRLTTWTARTLGRSVSREELQPGDMIISNGGKHMTMYVGDGRVIAAPRTGTKVQYQPLSRFNGDIVDIRRVL